MAVYVWRESFIDERECRVEAESITEARMKMEAGDWLSEQTVDFYSNEILQPLELEGEK